MPQVVASCIWWSILAKSRMKCFGNVSYDEMFWPQVKCFTGWNVLDATSCGILHMMKYFGQKYHEMFWKCFIWWNILATSEMFHRMKCFCHKMWHPAYETPFSPQEYKYPSRYAPTKHTHCYLLVSTLRVESVCTATHTATLLQCVLQYWLMRHSTCESVSVLQCMLQYVLQCVLQCKHTQHEMRWLGDNNNGQYTRDGRWGSTHTHLVLRVLKHVPHLFDTLNKQCAE